MAAGGLTAPVPAPRRHRCLFWVDVETCSLDPQSPILEIAVVLTDDRLREIGAATHVIRHPWWLVNQTLSTWSRETHRANGLLQEVAAAPLTVREAEAEILRLMDRYDPVRHGKWIPAGSTVGFDVKVIQHWMPKLAQRLFFRMLDVSVFQISVDLFSDRPPPLAAADGGGGGGGAGAAEEGERTPSAAPAVSPMLQQSPPKREYGHRAEGDIRDSLRLGRHFRTHLFGKPDSE